MLFLEGGGGYGIPFLEVMPFLGEGGGRDKEGAMNFGKFKRTFDCIVEIRKLKFLKHNTIYYVYKMFNEKFFCLSC